MVIVPINQPGLVFNLTAANNTADMRVKVEAWNSAGTKVIQLQTSGTPIIRNQWNRVLVTIKQSTNDRKIEANGTDQALTVTTFSTTDIMSLSQGFGADDILFFVKGNGSGVPLGNPLLGALYRPWIDAGSGKYFYAPSKFWTAGGSPVGLGSNGQLPTGTPPLFYLPNGPENCGINAGTSGNLTIGGAFTGIMPPT